MLFYLGLDDAKSNTFKDLQVLIHKSMDDSFDGAITVTGRSRATGWFCLSFLLHPNDNNDNSKDNSDKASSKSRLSYYGRKSMGVLEGSDMIMNEKNQYDRMNMMRARSPHQQLPYPVFDDQGNLLNIPKHGEKGDCSF